MGICNVRKAGALSLCLLGLWPQTTSAIGYEPLPYALPKPGTYELPSLGLAADGEVLTSKGVSESLHKLFGSGNTLLAFIYSTCSDVNGCPLSSHVLYKISQKIRLDNRLQDNLRIVSLSFDPLRDTPEVMNLYEQNFSVEGMQETWQFITTAGKQQLEPILTAYGQDVQRIPESETDTASVFSHTLRVFLIDEKKRIRNIYNVDFLHDELVINDVLTLLTHDKKEEKGRSVSSEIFKPGDFRQDYNSAAFSTKAQSIETRKGEVKDLLELIPGSSLGLGRLSVPENNFLNADRVDLGRKLFFDRRLSLNDTFSCAMCHIPEQGFTSNEMATAVGIEGRTVRRNAPTLLNTGYLKTLFHDGREYSLEQQIWAPLLANNEMANPSVGHVMQKVEKIDNYEELFRVAYPQRGLTMESLGMAMASYQRTLVAGNSPFDQWFYRGLDTISDDAKKGYEIFVGKGNCVSCHSISAKRALLTDEKFHNTGVGYSRSMGLIQDNIVINIAPGIFVSVDSDIVDSVSEESHADLGRYEITQNPSDRWAYRTPSLRNVALTGPYMHDGSFSSLREVVQFYNSGGVLNEEQSPLIRPLELIEPEIDNLVEFLKSLTGSNVQGLISDAFAAPIGDVTRRDPSWVHGSDFEIR